MQRKFYKDGKLIAAMDVKIGLSYKEAVEATLEATTMAMAQKLFDTVVIEGKQKRYTINLPTQHNVIEEKLK